MVSTLVTQSRIAGCSGRRSGNQAKGELHSMSAEENCTWVDPLGLDSEYNYDPFWAKCIELGVAPTMHSHAIGLSHRTSISSYNYNHIGHFADASEITAKAMFLCCFANK